MTRQIHTTQRVEAGAIALFALVAVVAVASGGSAPSGSIGAHRPSEGLLDAVVSLFIVAMVVCTVLVAVMLSFLFGAVATPTGDAISMLVLAIPITVLYFAAVGIGLVLDRRRERRIATEDAAYIAEQGA